jgi:hypothetical protein
MDVLENADYVNEGKVNAAGMAQLKARMPFADLSKFEKNPELAGISDLFTVEMITHYIEGKLASKN